MTDRASEVRRCEQATTCREFEAGSDNITTRPQNSGCGGRGLSLVPRAMPLGERDMDPCLRRDDGRGRNGRGTWGTGTRLMAARPGSLWLATRGARRG